MLNLDKYAKLRKEREYNKKKSYKQEHKRFLNEIETVMIQDINFHVFEVEPFIMGEVEYNMLECVDYIIDQVQNDKNFIKILEDIHFCEPNLIYVKWNLEKIT